MRWELLRSWAQLTGLHVFIISVIQKSLNIEILLTSHSEYGLFNQLEMYS